MQVQKRLESPCANSGGMLSTWWMRQPQSLQLLAGVVYAGSIYLNLCQSLCRDCLFRKFDHGKCPNVYHAPNCLPFSLLLELEVDSLWSLKEQSTNCLPWAEQNIDKSMETCWPISMNIKPRSGWLRGAAAQDVFKDDVTVKHYAARRPEGWGVQGHQQGACQGRVPVFSG